MATRKELHTRLMRDGYTLTPDGCHEWKGARISAGYGHFYYRGEHYYAHRLACALRHGLEPTELARHKCDNPACFNPDHLEPGTHKENVADMWSRGREVMPAARLGTEHHAAKLSELDVRAIRAACASGCTQREQGELYGISQVTVSRIVRRKAWSHIA